MSGPLSFGRMTAALATVHNENSASLATANIDFTLIKVEAPVEFGALGATISRRRKVDAEEGGLHKTARKLGALFGKRLPPTEDLFRVYGKRVSEISSIESINPRSGTDRDGIFASHIGADTASIWAAVTSGSAAIAAHLLGCMLARVFTGPEAISAWVELVEKQKEWIHNEHGRGLYSEEHQGALNASQQDISRSDLAKWDASARAWLQSADQAKPLQHKQTMLILDSTSLPVNNEPRTYDSIMKAWIVALEAMNKLAKGIPQRVQDGAALLAMSSWHLYPDMIVYSTTSVEVRQKDPLFDRAALLTLGLQHAQDVEKSVYWSLPLAFLQYYGHPVQASRSMGQENSRVTIHQFAYIIMGCIFETWNVFASTNEKGLLLIHKIGGILELKLSPQHHHDQQQNLAWLVHIFVAARGFLDGDDSEKKLANQLMNLGRRRSHFLLPPSMTTPPLFGLAHIEVILQNLRGNDQRVDFLRCLAINLELDPTKFMIKCFPSKNEQIFAEYVTISPIQRSRKMWMHDGNTKERESSSKNMRWLSLSQNILALCIRRKGDLQDIPGAINKLRTLEKGHGVFKQKVDGSPTTCGLSFYVYLSMNPNDETLREIVELKNLLQIAQRIKEVEELGEVCLPVVERHSGFHWKEGTGVGNTHHPSIETLFNTILAFGMEEDFFEGAKDVLEEPSSKRNHFDSEAKQCKFFAGNHETALCSLSKVSAEPTPPLSSLLLDSDFMADVFESIEFSKKELGNWISSPGSRAGKASPSDLMNVENLVPILRVYAIIAGIYNLLPGATISTLVLNIPLREARWIPRYGMTLPQAFACIAMFESGTCNIDPSTLTEVFAMSSGNSLYVAGALLCDPYEQPGPAEIRRVVGNIGRPGINFLICPTELKIREPDPEKWMAINHGKYDGKLEDHFGNTSVHLSFTQYEIPLVTENNPRHFIDRAIVLIETLVSVHDGSDWVAEVNILKALESINILRVLPFCHGQHVVMQAPGKSERSYQEALSYTPQLLATSVENWDELLETSQTGLFVICAHKNWLA